MNRMTRDDIVKWVESRGSTISRNTPFNWSRRLRDTGLVEKAYVQRRGGNWILLFSPLFAVLMLARARNPWKYTPGRPSPDAIVRALRWLVDGGPSDSDIEETAEWLGLFYINEDDLASLQMKKKEE